MKPAFRLAKRNIIISLLGTRAGDARGLPFEGLAARSLPPNLDEFRIPLWPGLVSDDTELSVLTAWSLLSLPVGAYDIADAAERAFRRGFRMWLLALPFGAGFGTLRAAFKNLFFHSQTAAPSAGNGAAMRAPVIGAALPDSPLLRRKLTLALSAVTHSDPRALEFALFSSEVSALAFSDQDPPSRAGREVHLRSASAQLKCKALCEAIDWALAVEKSGAFPPRLLRQNKGYAPFSAAICAYAYLRGDSFDEALELAIRCGGDTDTHAAIVGAWRAKEAAGQLIGDAEQSRSSMPYSPVKLLRLSTVHGRESHLPRLVRGLLGFGAVVLHALTRRLRLRVRAIRRLAHEGQIDRDSPASTPE